MIVTGMAVSVRRDGHAGLAASAAASHPAPGSCPRLIVVELAPGRSWRLYATTHADSGLIMRRSAAAETVAADAADES